MSDASASSQPASSSTSPAILVVAAVIQRDGKILIGQRKRTGSHPLKWEFPGGKVEPGEDPLTATARELEEELGIRAEVGDKMDSYQVRYGSGPLTQLIFYSVTRFTGEPRNLDFEQILWEAAENFGNYDFLEGDLRFIEGLNRQPLKSRQQEP